MVFQDDLVTPPSDVHVPRVPTTADNEVKSLIIDLPTDDVDSPPSSPSAMSPQ